LEVLCQEESEGGVPPGELPYPRDVASMITEGWVETVEGSPVVLVKATPAGCEELDA
jgi:hypothetical protein